MKYVRMNLMLEFFRKYILCTYTYFFECVTNPTLIGEYIQKYQLGIQNLICTRT